jgi:hypothetical protein
VAAETKRARHRGQGLRLVPTTDSGPLPVESRERVTRSRRVGAGRAPVGESGAGDAAGRRRTRAPVRAGARHLAVVGPRPDSRVVRERLPVLVGGDRHDRRRPEIRWVVEGHAWPCEGQRARRREQATRDRCCGIRSSTRWVSQRVSGSIWPSRGRGGADLEVGGVGVAVAAVRNAADAALNRVAVGERAGRSRAFCTTTLGTTEVHVVLPSYESE